MSLALLVRQAAEHHRAGRLDQAEDIYRFLGAADPANAQVSYLRGLLAQDRGHRDAALDHFRKAMAQGLGAAEGYFQIGRTHALAGDVPAAMSAYRQALAADAARVDALCNLANLQVDAGEHDDALENYRKALVLAPELATVHYNLGTLRLKRFEPALAQGHLRAAVQLRPDYATAWNSLGVAMTELGEAREAVDAFRRASDLAPEFVEPLFNRHGNHVDLGEMAEAIACMRRAVAIQPSEAPHRFFLAMLCEYGGDAAEGVAMLAALRADGLAAAEIDSWDYLRATGATKAGAKSAMTGGGRRTFDVALEGALAEGLVLEFGVYHGKSIRQIAALVDGVVHGFDSFEGIPEGWGDEPKGAYSTGGRLPEVPDNVRLHRGWFDASLPAFLSVEAGPVRFVNIDCDLYSSTCTVLDLLAPRIVTGTVIVFDEFIGYASWRQDEFKAFHEAVDHHGWRYEILCFSFVTRQVAVRITRAAA